MTDAETQRDQILSRLRAGMVEELADLVVDHILDRPVTELVDPDWLAGQVVHSLQAATAGPRTEDWLREQVQGLRSRCPKAGSATMCQRKSPIRFGRFSPARSSSTAHWSAACSTTRQPGVWWRTSARLARRIHGAFADAERGGPDRPGECKPGIWPSEGPLPGVKTVSEGVLAASERS